MNGNNYYTSQRMYILLLELKSFFFLTIREWHYVFAHTTVLFYRSIHVQDVSQGLLKNCWKKEGV